MIEVFGAVGYRDGGKRFITVNPQPPEQPQQALLMQRLQAQIERDRAAAGRDKMMGTAAVARAQLDAQRHADTQRHAAFDHGHQLHDRLMRAHDQGHRHAMEIAGALDARAQAENGGPGGEGAETMPEGMQAEQPDIGQQLIAALTAPRQRQVEFVRDPATGRIAGARVVEHP
jgi:hypothetical protein